MIICVLGFDYLFDISFLELIVLLSRCQLKYRRQGSAPTLGHECRPCASVLDEVQRTIAVRAVALG
jgi:hypothetical protein